MRRTLTILFFVAAVGALAWAFRARFVALNGSAAPTHERLPIPVEIAAVEHGPLALRRTFSGTLESPAEFSVAPKISGRLARLEVELGDTVKRGQVVARLDDAELVQAVRQAEAELAVARAGESEAGSAREIAERALRRAEALSGEGLSSESMLDTARSGDLVARARVEVAAANTARAESELESAHIRLGYATIAADWNGGDETRVVAVRYVDDGETVSANAPLLAIVELDPLVAVVDVPERDYANLAVGQVATLTTDSYASATFTGAVERIAPIFRRSTRQARVEVLVANTDQRLRPGMFVRATLELKRFDNATTVPFDALTERGLVTGVFVLDAARKSVAWRPVEVGARDGTRVQILGEPLDGFVVVLGQESCDDGSRVAPVQTGVTSAP